MVTINTLYNAYETISEGISAKKTESELSSHFDVILKGVKFGAQEKKLSSQFIVRFFNNFPGQKLVAFNSMLDLLEDEDSTIRSVALNDILSICKKDNDFITRVADTCAQLFVTEVEKVTKSVIQLCKINFKLTMDGFIEQLFSCFEAVKDNLAVFFAQLPQIFKECGNITENGEYFISKITKILESCNVTRVIAIIPLISELPILTLANRKSLSSSVIACVLGAKAQTEESLLELAKLVSLSSFLFSANVKSNEFADFCLNNFVSKLVGNDLTKMQPVLFALVDSTTHCDAEIVKNENVKKTTANLLLKTLLKEISTDSETLFSTTESCQSVEALLTLFHRFGKFELISGGEGSLMSEIIGRCQRVGLLSQTEYNKSRSSADKAKLKSLENIKLIVRDLIHVPPVFKAVIYPSWSSPLKDVPQLTDKPIPPLKRESPNTLNNKTKRIPPLKKRGPFNRRSYYSSTFY